MRRCEICQKPLDEHKNHYARLCDECEEVCELEANLGHTIFDEEVTHA